MIRFGTEGQTMLESGGRPMAALAWLSDGLRLSICRLVAISRCPVGIDILAGCRRNGSASLFTGIEIAAPRERGGMIVADPDRAECPYRAPAFLGHSLRESVR